MCWHPWNAPCLSVRRPHHARPPPADDRAHIPASTERKKYQARLVPMLATNPLAHSPRKPDGHLRVLRRLQNLIIQRSRNAHTDRKMVHIRGYQTARGSTQMPACKIP
jgi:hypothetical protein